MLSFVTYTATRFGDGAAASIEAKLPERERETLTRALRSRPAGSDPLTVVDYLYLGQLPPLLFANDVWQYAKTRLSDAADAKQRLQLAHCPDRPCPKRNRARARSRAGPSAQSDCSMRGGSVAALRHTSVTEWRLRRPEQSGSEPGRTAISM